MREAEPTNIEPISAVLVSFHIIHTVLLVTLTMVGWVPEGLTQVIFRMNWIHRAWTCAMDAYSIGDNDKFSTTLPNNNRLMFMKLFLSKDYVKNLILSRLNDHSDDRPSATIPFTMMMLDGAGETIPSTCFLCQLTEERVKRMGQVACLSVV